MAWPTSTSLRYISAVSISVAPKDTPLRNGSLPPLYFHVPKPISGTITPVLPSSFISIMNGLLDPRCV